MPSMPQPPAKSNFDTDVGPNPIWTRWFLQVFQRLGGSVGDTVPEVSAALAVTQADVTALTGRVETVESESGEVEDRVTILETSLGDTQDRVSTLETATPQLLSKLVSTLPAASANIGRMYLVTNESGGSVPAFSDGTSWRRVTDRAVVS